MLSTGESCTLSHLRAYNLVIRVTNLETSSCLSLSLTLRSEISYSMSLCALRGTVKQRGGNLLYQK